MGRSMQQSMMRDARHQLLSMPDLKKAWRVACKRDVHDAKISIRGTQVMLESKSCGGKMSLEIKFGRPKTFAVTAGADNQHVVGKTSVRAVRMFLRRINSEVKILKPDTDDNKPKYTNAMSFITWRILAGVVFVDAEPVDFASMWRTGECKHASALARLYGNNISLECPDCGLDTRFTHFADEYFNVNSTIDGEFKQCGMYGSVSVVGHLREFAKSYEIPQMMADTMSPDPERDARDLVGLARILVQHGLLRTAGDTRLEHMHDMLKPLYLDELPRRTDDDDGSEVGRMIRNLSAAGGGRAEFVQSAKRMVAQARDRGAQFTWRGAYINMRVTVELFRLAWPHWFESDHADVYAYDPNGMYGLCIQCGFSTLDGDAIGDAGWDCGCPACNYGGLLLGMK